MFKTTLISRIFKREGNLTEVTLRYKIILPEWYFDIPWKVEKKFEIENIDYNIAKHVAIITVSGKSKKSPDDDENELLGKKLAESRAKLKFYKSMKRMIGKIYQYYSKLLFSSSITVVYINDKDNLYYLLKKYKAQTFSEKKYLERLILNIK